MKQLEQTHFERDEKQRLVLITGRYDEFGEPVKEERVFDEESERVLRASLPDSIVDEGYMRTLERKIERLEESLKTVGKLADECLFGNIDEVQALESIIHVARGDGEEA